jgi:hypothetical protein
MLHIKYKLAQDDEGKLRLLADEDLPKGRVVYSTNPVLDVDIPADEFDRMDPKTQEEIRQWGFLLEPEDVWHVDFDITRFVRHSSEPNLIQDSGHKDTYLVTARDIKTGEELTHNYLGEEKNAAG